MWLGNTDIDNGSDVVRFEYDADESRVRKVATDNASSSASITTYMEGTYERRLDPSDDVHIYYLGNGSRVIGQLEVSLSDSDYATTYFHVDHLGSPELMTDEDGVVGSGHRSFSAFGEARDPDDWTVLISPPTVDRNIGYTGHQATDAYGLVDMRGRQYDPGIGAFTTADPFVPDPSLSQSFNRYAYVRNNPLRLVDPSGFEEFEVVYQAGGGPDRYYQIGDCSQNGTVCPVHGTSPQSSMIFIEDSGNVPQGEDGTGTDGGFLLFGMGLGMGIDANQAQKGTAETTVRHEAIANLPYTLAGNLLGGGLGIVGSKLLGPLISRVIPMLARGSGGKMLGAAIAHLRKIPGNQRAKAFEKLAAQITKTTDGQWSAKVLKATNAQIFAGEGGEALVFDTAGKMFRGNLGDRSAFIFREGGQLEVVFNALKGL